MVLDHICDPGLATTSAPAVRRLEAEGTLPGGWLLEGDRMAMPEGDIWGMISNSLQKNPASPCISHGTTTLSCSDVLEAVNGIPWAQRYRRIGLHLPRSLDSVILTLAIWKNGGVYVPIAADYPVARVEIIARGCSLDLIIADRALDLPGYTINNGAALGERDVVFHVRDHVSEHDPADRDLCYVAHTSGSTGVPKGVRLSHANLLNRIVSMQHFLGIEPGDRILYKTSAVFDVHVWEFTLPLASGCLLVIHPQTKYFDLLDVARLIVAEQVTIAGFVPSLLRLLLDNRRFTEGNALRAMLCGGEAWNVNLAQDFHDRMPGRRLYNSYGPAETTIAVANWPVPEHAGLQNICLGRPLPNLVFLIEDRDSGAIVPGEVDGILCVGGGQVALGYVAEQGQSRFFCRSINGERMRFYRTGDLVSIEIASGSLHYKGREDNQVKVNGVRIDPAEIEETIGKVAGIESCVAFATEGEKASQLCAVYKTRGNIPIDPSEIRRTCMKSLPGVLIPARLRQVSNIPLTPSGKIDRARLIAEFRSSLAGR